MTEPEEEVKAPLDPPDEDEVLSARSLETISSLEDLETLKEPDAPESVTEAVDEAMEEDDEEYEGQEGEVDEDAVVLPPDEAGEPGEEGVTGEGPVPDSHTVKINGEEYTLTTEDLVSGYQQAAASQQRFQEAAKTEMAAKNIINNVLDPEKSVDTMIDLYSDQMGGDRDKATEMVDDIIGKRIQHLIDLEEMSEDERQVYDLTTEKDRMANELAAHKAHQEEARKQEYINYQNNQTVPLLDSAISRYNLEVGSAQDVEASQILAEYIRQGQPMTQELVDHTVADVVNRRAELLHNTVAGMSAEDLLTTNPNLAAQVQQAKAEEIKASRTTETGTNQGSTPKRRRKAKSAEYTDSNEFFNDTDF